ncbi:MAG: Maf family nucleotide pyrophosphatase [Peptococcaceae bacterium]|jgi:septum formation protein|nr:Maf family nucleotide pyrophosphatase [Peptococcaceae bacterium]
MQKLILASASPRRQQILAYLGIAFSVKPSPIDEQALQLSGPPGQQASDSAKAKALAAAEADRDSWILAADTVVAVDGTILGKPSGREDARRMLTLLSDRSHSVMTGVCLHRFGEGAPTAIYEETKVWMASLTDPVIEAYLDTDEPWDKAGAYAIQAYGGSLIPRIEGCFFNVMGLPLYRTARLLEAAGFMPLSSAGGLEAASFKPLSSAGGVEAVGFMPLTSAGGLEAAGFTPLTSAGGLEAAGFTPSSSTGGVGSNA